MPRQPSFIHPLRRVRDCLVKSQKEFAAMVGVSVPTIQAVELGQLAVSRSLALRICAATGVDPDTISTPSKSNRAFSKKKISKRIPRDLAGRVYDSTSFEIHTRFDFELANLLTQMHARRSLEVLFAAAEAEHKFPAIYISFCEWVDRIREDAGVVGATRKLALTLPPIEERVQNLFPGKKLSLDTKGAIFGSLAFFGRDQIALGAAPVAFPDNLADAWREGYAEEVKAAHQHAKEQGLDVGPLRVLTERDTPAAVGILPCPGLTVKTR